MAAVDYLAKGNALASIRRHELTMAAADPTLADEYNRLLTENVVDLLSEVMGKFYADLGIDAHSVPLMRVLDRFRKKLTGQWRTGPEPETTSPLIRFERAWRLYRRQQSEMVLPLFEAVFRDVSARKTARRDPFVKEVVVRSGEILGRYHDTRGDLDKAITIYREIVGIDPDGIIARRLALLLTRRGDLRQAANLAESVVFSRPNLFPYLHVNSYIAELKAELSDTGEPP
jgi:tetratricopeptide (TPR) repeat protein